jgi:hypothetical protein
LCKQSFTIGVIIFVKKTAMRKLSYFILFLLVLTAQNSCKNKSQFDPLPFTVHLTNEGIGPYHLIVAGEETYGPGNQLLPGETRSVTFDVTPSTLSIGYGNVTITVEAGTGGQTLASESITVYCGEVSGLDARWDGGSFTITY